MELPKFNSIVEFFQAFPDQAKCIEYLESVFWRTGVRSPFDITSKVYKCKEGRYRCKNTKKYFNVRTGTIFDDTKLPLQKWFLAIYLLAVDKKGISSYQLAEKLNITQTTAWKMMHKIRMAMGNDAKQELSGEIEMDETFIGGKEKNKHLNKKNKKWYQRAAPPSAGKTVVFGMIERGGNVVAKMIKNRNKEHITPHINAYLKEGSTVFTDDYYAYQDVQFKHSHIPVNHSAHQYVQGNAHTNNIENFWSRLKRGINGVYHHVTKQHMEKYLSEFCFRHNTRKITTTERFHKLLSLTRLQPITI